MLKHEDIDINCTQSVHETARYSLSSYLISMRFEESIQPDILHVFSCAICFRWCCLTRQLRSS